jgi:hypothetical protein
LTDLPAATEHERLPGVSVRGLVTNLTFNVVLPLITVNVLQHQAGVVRALAIAAVFPALEVAVTGLRRRRVDALGIIVLALIGVGVAASLLTGDVHFALAKESLGTGVFGLLCMGSFFLPRPLMFFVGRTFSTGNDPALISAWNDRWQYPQFRHVIRVITAAWGIAFLIEAAARVVLAYVSPVNVVIVASPTLALAVTAGLMAWTVRYSRAAERRAAESLGIAPAVEVAQ